MTESRTLWRGLVLGLYPEDEAHSIIANPLPTIQQAMQGHREAGIHWTDNPNSAYNFALDKDPDGWSHEMDADEDDAEWTLGFILEAEIEVSHLLEEGSEEWEGYAFSDSIFEHSHGENEVTVRANAPLDIVGAELVWISPDGHGGSKTVSLRRRVTAGIWWKNGDPVTLEDMERIAIDHGVATPELLASWKADHHQRYWGFLEGKLRQAYHEMWGRGELTIWTGEGPPPWTQPGYKREGARDEMPRYAPETSPIPAGHYRLFHRTPLRNADSIRRSGLGAEHSRQLEFSGEMVWGTYGFRSAIDINLAPASDWCWVEYHVEWDKYAPPPSEGNPYTSGSIPPSQIIFVWEPWHFGVWVIASEMAEGGMYQTPEDLEFLRSEGAGYAKALDWLKTHKAPAWMRSTNKYAVVLDQHKWKKDQHPRGQPGNAGEFRKKDAPAPAQDGEKPEEPAPKGEQSSPQQQQWVSPSTSGAGTKEDPLHTDNVEDAVAGLVAGLHVELQQPRQVSTLLDRLADEVQKIKETGQKASINLCNVTAKGTNLFCVESKGIPRIKMPQLKVGKVPPDSRAAKEITPNANGEYDLQPLFLQRLVDNGVSAESTKEKASYLKASQSELNGEKVAGMMEALLAGKSLGHEPIFVSNDNYIVDGHHRWAATVAADWANGSATDLDLDVWRIDMDIITLLDQANKFSAEYGVPNAGITASKKPCGCGCDETKEAALSLEALISVAEHAMEEAGLAGPWLNIPTGHQDDPAYQAAIKPFVDRVRHLTGDPHLRFYASDYQINTSGGQAYYDGNSIVVRPLTNEMTVLHECAHAIIGLTGERGHTREFCEEAAALYSKHISPEAGAMFRDLVMPSRTAFSAPVPLRVRTQPPANPQAPRPVKLDPRAEGDIRNLDTDDEGRVRDILREIARGKVELERKERPPLEDCFSADAGSSVRILMYPHIDGSWHVFYVGYHDYNEAERRLEKAARLATDSQWQKAVQVGRLKIRQTPSPTLEDKKRHAEMVERQRGSRAGGDSRGNSEARARRQEKLLAEFGDGRRAPCLLCGQMLDEETVTADRIWPGAMGGSYRYENVVPACWECNASRPDVKLTARDIGSYMQQRAASLNTTAVVMGIPVVNVKPQSGGYGSMGFISDERPVLAYRGFGSWGELKDAIKRGYWKATPNFTVKGEGDTQMALSIEDVVRSSGFHRLRGTGFLAIMEADISGLPFETHMPITDDPAAMHGRPGEKFFVGPRGAGVMYPDLGLGVGIKGGIPLDRINTIYEVEDKRIARSWPFNQWESHIDEVRDNPDWSHRKKIKISYPVSSSKALVHALTMDQDRTICNTRLGDVKREVALVDPSDLWTRPESIRNFWGKQGTTFSIRESQRCPRCLPSMSEAERLHLVAGRTVYRVMTQDEWDDAHDKGYFEPSSSTGKSLWDREGFDVLYAANKPEKMYRSNDGPHLIVGFDSERDGWKLGDGYTQKDLDMNDRGVPGTQVVFKTQERVPTESVVSVEHLAKTAMPTSWRPMTNKHFWLSYDAVITSEGGGSGRRSYEVYVHGQQVASRPTLTEAKAVVEAKYGAVIWNMKRMDPVTTDHYYFGPTTEFTSPQVIWCGELEGAAV